MVPFSSRKVYKSANFANLSVGVPKRVPCQLMMSFESKLQDFVVSFPNFKSLFVKVSNKLNLFYPFLLGHIYPRYWDIFSPFYWDIFTPYIGTFYPFLLGHFYPLLLEHFYSLLLGHFYPMLLGHFTPFFWDKLNYILRLGKLSDFITHSSLVTLFNFQLFCWWYCRSLGISRSLGRFRVGGM